MSGIEVAGLALAAIPVAFQLLTSAGYRYRTARFGPVWGTIFYLFRFIDTDTLQRRHWDINTWTDEEIKTWKDSHLASCNAIAVAGAIFASLGLTALQLPDMDKAHWSARACCIASMVLGVVSVTTATREHQVVGTQIAAVDVRLWMSRGRPSSYRDHASNIFGINEGNSTSDKYKKIDDFERLPLESSISGLKEVALPRHLLNLAVVVFMLGIGLYELSGWLSVLTRGRDEATGYRNVFIVFVITLGLYLLYDIAINIARVVDDDKRNHEFETNTLGGFHGPEKLRQLERSLGAIRKAVGQIAVLDDVQSRHTRLVDVLDEMNSTTRRFEIVKEKLAGVNNSLAKSEAMLAERSDLAQKIRATNSMQVDKDQQIANNGEEDGAMDNACGAPSVGSETPSPWAAQGSTTHPQDPVPKRGTEEV